jgi:hypothetical protein
MPVVRLEISERVIRYGATFTNFTKVGRVIPGSCKDVQYWH